MDEEQNVFTFFRKKCEQLIKTILKEETTRTWKPLLNKTED